MAGGRIAGVVVGALLTAVMAGAVPVVHGANGQGGGAGEAAGVSAAPRTRAVPARLALGQPLRELSVDNVSLERVLNYLRDTSGANVVVNWRVLEEQANVTRETPITLSVREVSLRKVLRLVLDQASPEVPLVFPVESNVISVTTEQEADKNMITRVYIVDDLVMTNNNPAPPPSMNLQTVTSSGTTSGGTTGSTVGGGTGSLFEPAQAAGGNTQEDTPQQRGNDLVTLIQEVVRPTIWRANGGTASIRYFNGKLIVTAPVSVQEAIGGPAAPEGGQRLGM